MEVAFVGLDAPEIPFGGEAGNTHHDSVSQCILVAVQTRGQLVAVDPVSERVAARSVSGGRGIPSSVVVSLRVRRPVASGIAKWVYRHTSQDVCPWNVKFSRDATESAFTAREFIDGKDPRTLADDVLAMDDETFRTVFKKSAIKRAKRGGLVRNARVVLQNARK